jgi:DNA-binding transcriptional regulator LsrR (DeoR family)
MNSLRTDVHIEWAATPPGVSEADYRLCVRAAMLYYRDGLSQSEIGDQLGYSRIKINRVLGMARTLGILEIRVKVPAGWHIELESDLASAYGLRGAVVISSDSTEPVTASALAEGAATWLTQHIQPKMRIGLGIGRTLSHLPETFRLPQPVDCTFIEVLGTVYTQDWATLDVTSKMAELAGGSREVLQAPGFVTNPDLGLLLAKEPAVADALKRARESDIMMQSVGPVDTSAILYLSGVLGSDDLADLTRRGAVGDALGYYYNIEGKRVQSRTDSNLIGIDLDDLRDVPWSVLVAGGTHKVEPIVGGLRGGYFNVLVTDDTTAAALLEHHRTNTP